MGQERHHCVVDLPEWRDRTGVFASRLAAGEILAEMLLPLADLSAVVLAIPTGGIPVAAPIAERYRWPLDVVVASKITPAWNPEVAFGAVTDDGDVEMGESVGARFGLSAAEISDSIGRARQRVARRSDALRGHRQRVSVARRCVVLVDDGLATGMTMIAAARSVLHSEASRLVVAVPTAHVESLARLGELVDTIYCPNVRSGGAFAVAQAYRQWTNMSDAEAIEALRAAQRPAARGTQR